MTVTASQQARNKARWAAIKADPVAYQEHMDIMHARRLRLRHNITPERYQEMFAEQNGLCKICGDPPYGTGNGPASKLHVDHDHSCCPDAGKSCGECVRGLLCARCNRAIGMMEDDPALLNKAAAYLRDTPQERLLGMEPELLSA